MSKPEFVYTTYIETTAEKLWQALTDGDFTERYWFGHRVASTGRSARPTNSPGRASHHIEGKVLAFEPHGGFPTPGILLAEASANAPRASPSISNRAARSSS